MKNFVQTGDITTATAPYDTLSGAGALIGTMFGVATRDILSGATGEYLIEGTVDLAKTAGGGTAWTEGAAIYWDNAAKAITKTSAGNTKIGVAVLPLPLDADVVGRVRLNSSF